MDLKQKLINRIQTSGPISVADYMRTCLFDETYGYYNTANFTDDFITAPELTPLFGEMLGLWVVDSWQKLGEPPAFSLVEAGAGNGTLMADMLNAIRYVSPDFHALVDIYIIEKSPRLRKIQQEKLRKLHMPEWVDNIRDVVTEQPMILITNELLDAFPIREYQRGKNNQYYERLVGLDAQQNLCFVLAENPSPEVTGDAEIIEISEAVDWFQQSCDILKQAGGYALHIDYGYTSGSGDTLQAQRAHAMENIFANVGKADLTAHVNFAELTGRAESLAHPVADLGHFLTILGLPTHAMRTRAKANPQQQAAIDNAVARLLSPNQMGSLHKVLILSTDELPTPAGVAEKNLKAA